MSVRSIPAYAGEPFLILILFLFRRVYPRVRGGAVFYWFSPLDFLGLSPRTRGSLLPRYSPRALGGSIPAYAGEPFLIECLNHVSGVYPRVRGGAKGPGSLEEGVEGLSPRTRGSRMNAGEAAGQTGSIPAYAGEPMGYSGKMTGHGVYPRVRGGAPSSDLIDSAVWGLSPRTRGSPDHVI